MSEATVTSKGQITVPKDIRERLNLKTGDRVRFDVDEAGQVRMSPVTRDISALKGCLPAPKQPVTIAEMDRAIRRRAAARSRP